MIRRFAVLAMLMPTCLSGAGVLHEASAQAVDKDRAARTSTADAAMNLARARQALTGKEKKPDAARRILLDLVKGPATTLAPGDQCMVYIYLGYIEDRAGNREAAIGWYRRALAVDGLLPRTRQLARSGMGKPITWLRHLDHQPETAARADWTKNRLAKATPAQRRARGSLLEARKHLSGKHKDVPSARRVLLDLAMNRASDLNATDLCTTHVYLGYIEDLAGNRDKAVGWFKKAAPLEDPGVPGSSIKGIREVARLGLTKPITWIRHLDDAPEGLHKSAWKQNVIDRIGKGFVTHHRPPNSLQPKVDLSKAQRLENFDILWNAIDRTYSFFEHKQIDWGDVRARYRPKVEAAETTDEFYRLVYQFVRELRDSHSWLCNYKRGLGLPRSSPDVSTALIEGKAVVTHVGARSPAFRKGIRPGWTITEVDGLSVKDKIEALRPLFRVYSSERHFMDAAHRRLLDGAAGSKLSLKCVPPSGQRAVEVDLRRARTKPPAVAKPAFPVSQGKYIWWGVHPSGCGYARIASFNGRMEIAREFDKALDELKETPGLIIDIRDNPGGFGTAQRRMVGRLITTKTKVAIAYTKSGPAHSDFLRRESYFDPAGEWQYTKPIVLLLNTRTGSAADLFACYLISTGRPITMGTTTHGNLTGQGAYVVLPCNLVVRVSNGYVSDAMGRIIEGRGNTPQIRAERTIADVVKGRDSVLELAARTLMRSAASTR